MNVGAPAHIQRGHPPFILTGGLLIQTGKMDGALELLNREIANRPSMRAPGRTAL